MKPFEPSDDPKTDAIIREIAIAAHEYGKSKTKQLTSLLKRRPGAARATFVQPSRALSEHPTGDPYEGRLFFREGQAPSDIDYVPPFAKDYARIIHSPSFRKLQGKSQLIPAGENYFFRTRLTHSLEVAEIATRIARKLNHDGDLRRYLLNHDLVACAALLHDIGHPPFGHSGEEVLNEKMADFGGFEGNAQTLRLVTRLENRLGRGGAVQDVYDDPKGLNLTVGTLAAILKYDRKYKRPPAKLDRLHVQKAYYPDEEGIVAHVKKRLGVPPEERLYTIECQIMDIADDIAYSAYDLEDTMESGIVTPLDFISVDDDMLENITRDVNWQLDKRKVKLKVTPRDVLKQLGNVFATILTYADTQNPYNMDDRDERAVFVGRSHNEAVFHEKNRLIRRQFLETLIEGNIGAISAKLNANKPFLSTLHVKIPNLLKIECMKAFNFYKVIASRKLQIPHHRSKRIIAYLFDALADDTKGALMSELEREQLSNCKNKPQRMRLVCDIIAGRTDMEATHLFNRLNSGVNGSVFDYS